ncbi:MAG: zinc ABC transporter substrate-binding protein [Muribaculaceae bacterium]|nr:zinc ABC transporter substrate-binding protein [Muribaculaceae bacterium]
MRHLSNLVILLGIFIATLSGCGGGQETDRPAIAVSFEPMARILQQIAGDDFDIITLLPAGSDPETYQPSIGTMKGLGNAEAFFTLGTDGFEKSLTSGIATNFPTLKVVDCTEGVDKIYGTHGHSHDHHNHDVHAHAGEDFDPHLLASIKNSIQIAENITSYLATAHPEKADDYRKKGKDLIQRMKAMDDSIANMNLNGKSFAMRHPSLSYFARDYGLNQIALQASGKESSPLQLRRQMEQMNDSGTKVYVMEKEHSSTGDKEMANQLGLKTIEVSLNSAEWINDLIKTANEINRD